MSLRFFRYFFIMLVAWCCNHQVAYSQIVTGLPNKQVCPGLSVSIPITYQNLTSVDSFQLVFTYNAAALTYSGYSYLHPYLLGARFNIQHQQGRIIMILRSGGALSFEDGSLIEFTFMTGLNTSNLEWDLSQSAYFLNANPLPASFTGGSIDIFPRIIISLQQLPAEVCPGSFAASIIASVRGGAPPYIYQWIGSPIQVLSDSIARNLATGFRYTLRITDNNSCVKDTSFYVKTRKLNQVEIQAKPDTVFISNPEVTFTAENKSTPFITKYLWRFGDGDSISTTSNSIIHLYDGVKQYVKDFGPEKPYSVSLTITNEYGCDTTITHTLVIKEAKIFVPNIFTPNGDGANDVFRIVLDDNKDKDVTYEFIKLELAVFNRWGRKVYSNDNYKNDWDGGNLADGVYFYALNTHGLFKTDTYKGAIHILR